MKDISYNIVIKSKCSDSDDRLYIDQQLMNFINKITSEFNVVSNNLVITHELGTLPKKPIVNTSKDDISEEVEISTLFNEEDYNKKIKESIERYSEKLFMGNNFDKYIDSLPKYYRRSRSKYEKYIKEYLIKNRSAKLADIVHGCKAHGLKFESYDLNSAFYKSLKNLVDDGKVTKKDKIYFWNYNE